jgi:hypothetical protein
MAYLTTDQLRQYPSRFTFQQRQAIELYSKGKTASTVTTIFLSHSRKDTDLISPAITFIATQGVIVYVDSKDPAMPEMTSPVTATKLKERIAVCRKFVLLATNSALDSRWVPWELGVADSTNGLTNIAVLPVVERSTTWRGNEYIGIYSRIEQASDGRWAVFPAVGPTGVTLDAWLRQ